MLTKLERRIRRLNTTVLWVSAFGIVTSTLGLVFGLIAEVGWVRLFTTGTNGLICTVLFVEALRSRTTFRQEDCERDE